MQALGGSLKGISCPGLSTGRQAAPSRCLPRAPVSSLQAAVPAGPTQSPGMYSTVSARSQASVTLRDSLRVAAAAGSVSHKELMDIAEEACRRGEQVRILHKLDKQDIASTTGLWPVLSAEQAASFFHIIEMILMVGHQRGCRQAS